MYEICHKINHMWGILFKRKDFAVTGEAQWVGCCPTKLKVASSIPRQSTGLAYGFGRQLQREQEATNTCFSLTSVFLSFSSSLPPLLSKSK